MVKNIAGLFQAFKFLESTPAEQQAATLKTLFRVAAPQYLNINDEQADIIVGLFDNPNVLDEKGIPNTSVLDDAFSRFNAAASPAVPLRVVCKECGIINKVD